MRDLGGRRPRLRGSGPALGAIFWDSKNMRSASASTGELPSGSRPCWGLSSTRPSLTGAFFSDAILGRTTVSWIPISFRRVVEGVCWAVFLAAVSDGRSAHVTRELSGAELFAWIRTELYFHKRM